MFNFVKSFFGQRPILGVDIGTTAIKIVELVSGEQKPDLKNYGILETYGHLDRPNNAIQANALKIAEKETAELLKKLVSQAGFSAKEAIASISPFSTFITFMELPVMPETDLKKTMSFQISQHIPLPLSEVTVEWMKVGERESDDGIKQQILLISIPNEIISRYHNIFKAAGLKLKFLEIESSSLTRALVKNDKTATLIADIGGRSTNIIIIDEGFLKASINIEIAGAFLTTAIANGLGVSARRAEELKKTKGLKAGAGQEELSTLPLPYLDSIIEEIRRTKNNFERNYGKKIERIMLAGGSANLAGISEYIENQINTPVAIGNSLLNVNYPREAEVLIKELGTEFAVAIGLAMKQYSK